MRTALNIQIVILLCSAGLTFGQSQENDQWLLKQRLPLWAKLEFIELDFEKKYEISDFINPFYLEADFNGDEALDVALLISEKVSDKKGILIIHQNTDHYFLIGAGLIFGNGGDNYDWFDIWKVERNLEVHELTYKDNFDVLGSKPLKLSAPGLEIQKSESGGGLIYWDGQKYKWAQTSE